MQLELTTTSPNSRCTSSMPLAFIDPPCSENTIDPDGTMALKIAGHEVDFEVGGNIEVVPESKTPSGVTVRVNEAGKSKPDAAGTVAIKSKGKTVFTLNLTVSSNNIVGTKIGTVSGSIVIGSIGGGERTARRPRFRL